MNFAKVSNRVSSHFVSDPYSTLMNYKKAFHVLKAMSDNKANILIIGHKNHCGIDWKSNFLGIQISRGRIDENVITSASNFYDLIMCLDMTLYAPYLKNINLPVMGVCTPKELHDYPEILQVMDYYFPAASSRSDAAIRQLLLKEDAASHSTPSSATQ